MELEAVIRIWFYIKIKAQYLRERLPLRYWAFDYRTSFDWVLTPFYDALCDQKTAVQVMGEDTLQEIAKELVGTVRKYAATPDWVQRKTTQAAMRQAVRRMLKDHGYPPTFAPAAVDTIIEQAQTMAFENHN